MIKKKTTLRENLFALVLPAMLAIAWGLALSGSSPPGVETVDIAADGYLRWLLYFAGYNFVASSVMHSLFAKKTAASIGWKTNGFQYELAAVSLGLGIGSFYAVSHGISAMTAISIPICVFLVLAGANHLKEIFRSKNYAPNNTLVLLWDFGLPISLIALLLQF